MRNTLSLINLQYVERSLGSSILVELELEFVGFCGGRKTEEQGEKPSEQGECQQQTYPTCGTGLESNPGHIGGRRALSRYSAIPLLCVVLKKKNVIVSVAN